MKNLALMIFLSMICSIAKADCKFKMESQTADRLSQLNLTEGIVNKMVQNGYEFGADSINNLSINEITTGGSGHFPEVNSSVSAAVIAVDGRETTTSTVQITARSTTFSPTWRMGISKKYIKALKSAYLNSIENLDACPAK